MIRKASALWEGGLQDGTGRLTTDSGVLSSTPYSFGTRFQEEKGTNPEELVAAAHAGCFSMALSAELGKTGIIPHSISTSCTIIFEKLEAGWTVVESRLAVTAKIPGADQVAFEAAAADAKKGCPISRLLNTKITMDAKLES